jgi:hypothetical protein
MKIFQCIIIGMGVVFRMKFIIIGNNIFIFKFFNILFLVNL